MKKSKKTRKAEKIRARREKYNKPQPVYVHPHVQKALEEARNYGDPSDIFKWWWLQTNFEWMCDPNHHVQAKFCPTGVVLLSVDDGSGYMEEAREVHVPWDTFWYEIVAGNDHIVQSLYEDYPEVVRTRWVRQDMSVDEWYDSLFI